MLIFLLACDGTKEPAGDDTGVATHYEPDSDGFTVEEGDCDDQNAEIFPGAEERCDGVDNNCDGAIDEGVEATFYEDADGDGYGDPETSFTQCEEGGGVADATDCDDADPYVSPAELEACNDIDDDCDGEVDEDVRGTWYADADGDGHGDPNAPIEACSPPEDSSANADDCDDTSARAYPGNTEVCDELDNNCDGTVDEGVTTAVYVDFDADGFGDPATSEQACDLPAGYSSNAADCDDGSDVVNPDAAEVCNAEDDNCDGTVDEDAVDAPTWYTDADGDTYGNPATGTAACAAPSGMVADNTDCDDGDASLNPATVWYIDYDADGYGATTYTLSQCAAPAGYVRDASDCDDATGTVNPGGAEVCNTVDDDCDGSIDEDSAADAATWYADTDGDGFGDVSSTRVACDAPAGFVAENTDCDDTDDDVSPDGVEVCGGADEDCDGLVDDDDDGVSGTSEWFVDADGDGEGDVLSAPIEACVSPADTSATAGDCDDADVDAIDCASCQEVLDLGLSIGDGVYTIDPASGAPFDVYCDMTTSGGGWTLLATNAEGGFWTSTTILSTTPTGAASLTADHKSQAWNDLDFLDLMFEDGTLWAEYDDVGDGTEDYYSFQAAIPVHNCGTTSGYAWTMDAGNLTGGTLCNTTLYMHPIDWDGGVNSTCSATFVNANNSYGPTWSTGNNNGCPLDDPSGSAFYAGAGATPFTTPLRMWAR